MKIFLMGFMGSGKSTVGKQLAASLGYAFLDTDSEIENRVSKSIAEIFSQDGESTFRKLEGEILKDYASKNEMVISTGGGMPCSSDHISLINKTGKSCYLYVRNEELSSRLWNSNKADRPLITQMKSAYELSNWIKDKLNQREAYYFNSHLLVDGNQGIDDIVTDLKLGLGL